MTPINGYLVSRGMYKWLVRLIQNQQDKKICRVIKIGTSVGWECENEDDENYFGQFLNEFFKQR